jgi:hypothetical protein
MSSFQPVNNFVKRSGQKLERIWLNHRAAVDISGSERQDVTTHSTVRPPDGSSVLP